MFEHATHIRLNTILSDAEASLVDERESALSDYYHCLDEACRAEEEAETAELEQDWAY